MFVPLNRSYKRSGSSLRNEFPGLQMTVPTDSLVLLKLGCEVIKKNKSFLERAEALQKTGSDEMASQDGVEGS